MEKIETVRKAILEAGDAARLLTAPAGEASRAKACVLTKLDEARHWLADFEAIVAHAKRV